MSDPVLSPMPAQPEQQHGILVGPGGLRAGWRLLIFLAMVVLLSTIVSAVAPQILIMMSKGFSPRNVILQDLALFAIIAIAAAIMCIIERRRFADYGLPARGFLGRSFWTGAAWGFIMLSVIMGMMVATHAYVSAVWPSRQATHFATDFFGRWPSCWSDSSKSLRFAAISCSRSPLESDSGRQR